MTKPKVLHFGAGNIGRGFIAPLLVASGYHVVFADVDGDTIDKLNAVDSYTVHIIGDKCQRQTVSNFSGVLSHDDDVIPIIADPATQTHNHGGWSTRARKGGTYHSKGPASETPSGGRFAERYRMRE
jgi:mannitol-1-phosphate/altronate dehydrogenase